MGFIRVLSLILISTTLASHFSKKIGIPAVIGQLLVGVILGKGMLDIVHSDMLVQEFSEIGVILLMFLAGIESDFGLLKKYMKPALYVACLGMLFPIVMSWGSGVLLGVNGKEALFFGIVLAATSVSISVEVMKELHVVDSKEGTTILGAAVIDDILTVLLVSLGISFLTGENDTSAGESLFGIGLQLVYFILIYFVVRWIAPYLLKLSKRLFASSAVIITSLIICLVMAFLADKVGLSSVIGAFFAGIAVGQTDVRKEVHFNTEALGYSVFIPVFFVSIGLNVEFAALGEQLIFIALFVIVALISKLIGGYFGAKFSGFSNHSSMMIGAGMVSRGEMALVILQLGVAGKLLTNEYYSALVIVILLTTLISPLVLKFFTKKVSQAQAAAEQTAEQMVPFTVEENHQTI